MKKVLSINRNTGILRSSIITPEHPFVNQTDAPSMDALHDMFNAAGVPLAAAAARKAMEEARIDISQITHVVSTTCTDAAHPGFDCLVIKELGITHPIETVLLQGAGCSGGLAALRTAASMALGHSFRRRPARILCVALEVCTTMARSELDRINELQETGIGVCLFSDCGAALVLSNGIGEQASEPLYSLLGWEHSVLPATESDLRFDIDSRGWKLVLTPRVPTFVAQALLPAFANLVQKIDLPEKYRSVQNLEWAIHPGGVAILKSAEKALGISPEHLRASYEVYRSHGNSSSATIFSVLDRARYYDVTDPETYDGQHWAREFIVGCAFGCVLTIPEGSLLLDKTYWIVVREFLLRCAC
ncbi:hypothetical protein PM082_002883 [Marasmius tenuissimus]|nr:hypothetical protein PM082_002883 [Marasmius tenuissimus]